MCICIVLKNTEWNKVCQLKMIILFLTNTEEKEQEHFGYSPCRCLLFWKQLEPALRNSQVAHFRESIFTLPKTLDNFINI